MADGDHTGPRTRVERRPVMPASDSPDDPYRRPNPDITADAGWTIAEGDATLADPSAPPVPDQDPSVVGSPQAQAVEGSEITLGGPPVTGAGVSVTGRAGRCGDRIFLGMAAGA